MAAYELCRQLVVKDELRRELGREPSENDVRARLNYPLILGRAEIPRRHLDFGGGCSLSLPGTQYRIHLRRDGELIHIELSELTAANSVP